MFFCVPLLEIKQTLVAEHFLGFFKRVKKEKLILIFCPLYLPFLVSWCRIFGEMSKNNSHFSHQKTEIVFREDQKGEVVSLSGH